MESGQTPKQKGETPAVHSGEVTWPVARGKRLQVLTVLAFEFPLAPASWVALRQHHGCQLLGEIGKPVAP